MTAFTYSFLLYRRSHRRSNSIHQSDLSLIFLHRFHPHCSSSACTIAAIVQLSSALLSIYSISSSHRSNCHSQCCSHSIHSIGFSVSSYHRSHSCRTSHYYTVSAAIYLSSPIVHLLISVSRTAEPLLLVTLQSLLSCHSRTYTLCWFWVLFLGALHGIDGCQRITVCILLCAINCRLPQIPLAYCENTLTGLPLILTPLFLKRTFTELEGLILYLFGHHPCPLFIEMNQSKCL